MNSVRGLRVMAEEVKTLLEGRWILERSENVQAYLAELGT